MVGFNKRIVSFGFFLALVCLTSGNLISSPSAHAANVSNCSTGAGGVPFNPTYFPNGCIPGACGPCTPLTGNSVCNVINASGEQDCTCSYTTCGFIPPGSSCPASNSGYLCTQTAETCGGHNIVNGRTYWSNTNDSGTSVNDGNMCACHVGGTTAQYCSPGTGGDVTCSSCALPTPTPSPSPTCAPLPTCTVASHPWQNANGSCLGCGTSCGVSSPSAATDWDCTANTTTDACGCAHCGMALPTTQGLADGCVTGSSPTPSVSPAPSATASPTASPTPSCLDQSGNGRQCNTDADCTCAGYVCAIVGNQPVLPYPGASSGSAWSVGWETGIPSGGIDILTHSPGAPGSSNSFVTTGPTKMCVDSNHVPSWGDVSLVPSIPSSGPANTNGNYQFLMPASAMPTPSTAFARGYAPSLLSWNGNDFVCNLAPNSVDHNRVSNQCACMANYEPAMLTTTQATAYGYNIHLGNPSLDTLWASVITALNTHDQTKNSLNHILHKVPPLFLSAQAGSCLPDGTQCGDNYHGHGHSGCSTSSTDVCNTCCSATGGAETGYTHTFQDDSDPDCSDKEYFCGASGTPTPTPTATPTPTPTPTPSGGTSPTPTVTPNPTAGPGASATPSNLYLDSGNYWNWNGLGHLFSATSQGYGESAALLDQPGGFPGANHVPAGDVITCVKTCPQNSPAWYSTLDTTGTTPTCDCSLGYAFDPIHWTCISCPTGSVILNGNCQCPQGWTISADGTQCVPQLPHGSNEFVATPYPVCAQGAGAQNSRLPTTYGLQITKSSGTSTPITSDFAQINSYIYKWSDQAVNNSITYPVYQYSNLPHCACMGTGARVGTDQGGSTPLTSGVQPLVASGTGGDTLDVITSYSSSGLPNKTYGMVAMALDGASDGRSAANFNNGSNAECGCPNVNEYPTVTTGNIIPGVTCGPVFQDPNRILATFNPATDDLAGKSQVYTRSNVTSLPGIMPGGYTEPLLKTSVTIPTGVVAASNVVPTISLPTSQSAPSQLALYQRHIWKCQIGYTFDLTSLSCKWGSPTNDHQCNSTSPISPTNGIGGTLSFANVINKKLACCMNNYLPAPTGGPVPANATQTSADVKFDCIDNTASATDFNTLWQSSDPTLSGTNQGTGGQMNAMVLAAASGKPLTGFYTADGARCNEFSEFDAQGIHPGTINPGAAGAATQQALTGNGGSNQFTATTSGPTVYQIQSSAGFQSLQAGFSAAGKSMVAPHPETGSASDVNNARRCPILVRAAMVATCPAVTTAQNAVHYTETSQPTGVTRCPQADHIQVHIRAEQVFTIAGTAPMQTVDTIVDNKDVNAISLDAIIRKKNGSQCLPGMVQGTSGCHY